MFLLLIWWPLIQTWEQQYLIVTCIDMTEGAVKLFTRKVDDMENLTVGKHKVSWPMRSGWSNGYALRYTVLTNVDYQRTTCIIRIY